MKRHVLALALAAALSFAGQAAAQTFPSRPITIVVPYPAGGPSDTLARILGERMKQSLGQSVIVENPTGAAGTIGTGRVARSAPDGYTVILGHWQTHVINGATYTLQFDVVKDFEPISLVADNPVAFVGKEALAAKDMKDLIAWMKANPGLATVGIGGVGGGADVVGSYFMKNTGTKFQFVPYRGAAPMIQDMLAGQIDLTFTQVASALVQIRAGKLKAYAVMAEKRWPALPNTPTLDEIGVKNIHASFWHGLWAPKGTPTDVIATLNAALVEALADPVVRKRFDDVGQAPWPRQYQNPAALAKQQQAEIDKWWPIVKEAGIKVQ